ncbi:expressed protein [Dictyostelium purpureum]|uniref:Expressed protein n=1 Tax=Dictyostelium purpureum TaxID=5786 RepID=F0ZEM9_DICPU|nr:uncharacterized protein DICPUDRAFT_97198 [Dictyostelium purpureum]EGC37617.1 expressed protein [Dictyostelium purpureum]|eukprot:XP_003285878.1 expressed protein [Dictyostelium purpureum]
MVLTSLRRRPLSISYVAQLLENKVFSEISDQDDLKYFTVCFVERENCDKFEDSIYDNHENDNFILRRLMLHNDTRDIVLKGDRACMLSLKCKNIFRRSNDVSSVVPEKIFVPSRLSSPANLEKRYQVYYYIFKHKRESINRLLISSRISVENDHNQTNEVNNNQTNEVNNNQTSEVNTNQNNDMMDQDNEQMVQEPPNIPFQW